MKIKALLDKKFKLGKKVIKYNNKLVDIREEIRNIEVQLEEFKKTNVELKIANLNVKELYDFLADLNKLFNKVQEKLLEYSNMYKSLQQEIDIEAAKLKDMSEEEINDYV